MSVQQLDIDNFCQSNADCLSGCCDPYRFICDESDTCKLIEMMKA